MNKLISVLLLKRKPEDCFSHITTEKLDNVKERDELGNCKMGSFFSATKKECDIKPVNDRPVIGK